ncbi:gp58-like family protein [Lactiplantibacillus pentosus]|uniref:phage tail protein n=1 Tax=Lactiplantibacillus pentosus TaxID=1589 RepID=UPI000AEAFEDF|nr:phage tail protein [Lactiplantibacillus pentosus]WNN86541.1 gp58-like family protein [Lactiplantibacillus pentosus]
MIKFYDSSGTVHFGQATITRKTSVNGGLSLTGEVFAGDDVLNGLDYGWWLNLDNEKYVITYKKLSDDTNTVVFDAVQQFFWDFSKVALHAQYTGSHEYSFYLGQLFDKSGYTYKNDATVPAFEKENWGYKNKLDLFNDIIDQAGVEFEVHNETVHIAKQIGSDLTSFARKGINLSDLTEEMKISDFATYAKGYGAFKDAEDQSKGRLEVEYRSELAKQFGDLEMDPIVDERYTIADNLIAALKKQVDATYAVSMTMNIYDLENAGYPNYEAPKVGDWILAIDEALNFKRKIRIIQLEEQFDVTGKRIGYTATCGDLNIVDQYTHLQISLDSKVQRIQKAVDAAASSANGKNTNYYGEKEPVSANEGDLWFDQSNSDPDKWSIKQWVNGRWEQITLNPGEIDAKVDVAKKEAETAVENAKSASDKADQLASKYDDTNALAHQALDRSVSAQSDANSAVAAANSTASEFGKVDQKAGSALASALNAQNDASDAVKQASSAAADSKDAQQIAGAVSQSYKTLTNGSTMTIAELENGLATKLTKTDLDGYATQTWTQNQINVTADGINGTMSSIKNTVDGQTTDINDLKADSSSFKSQFTTVNNTLGKQTTDISTLQATSKELTSGFNTLTTDNTTNKNDISQLKQTATELNSTMTTVQTQVQNSAVGTNLLVGTSSSEQSHTGDFSTIPGWGWGNFPPGSQPAVNVGSTYTYSIYFTKLTGSFVLGYWGYDSDKNYIGWFPSGAYSSSGKVSYTFTIPSGISYIAPHVVHFSDDFACTVKEEKLELGSHATDWCLNPTETATVTAVSKLSQTVDGMKLDISKKIEQKDLNGYATQTWAQNKINSTADGINATLSSVKTMVNGHTTSINDLKADSSSFKSQFTKVNNTLGKQSTDISTLQATSKSLSADFDSLSSDNTTNQHNISQLQASATEFNSTLMTVQQQVTDSAVGVNLLRNTRTLDGWKVWAGSGGGKGFNIEDKFSDSGQYRMAHIFNNVDGKNSDGPYWPGTNLFLNAGQVYTISIWAHSLGTSEQPVSWTLWLNWDKDHTYQGVSITRTTSPYWRHYSATFTATVGGQVNNVRIIPYFGTGAAANVGGSVYLLKPKLERGSRATDFSVNPADNATVDAVSSISQTVASIQTTVRGKVDNHTYQSKMTQLDNQITSVVGQVNTLGQRNLIANSQFQYDKFDGSTWTSDKASNWYSSDYAWSWWNGYQGICCNIPISNPVNTNLWNSIVSKKIYVPDTKSVYSGSAIFNVDKIGASTQLVLDWYDKSMKRIGYAPKRVTVLHKQTLVKIENQTPPAGTAYVALHVDVHGGGHLAVIAPMLVNAASVGSFVPDNASWTEFQQTASDINLKVSKDGVINAINVSPEGTTIYGNKLRITAATYIDNAVIKDAMIANLSANKLTAGSINAAKINVYNLNGSNIVAHSITADKLIAGSMLIAMNSTLQTLKIGTDGLYTTDRSGKAIGKIHTNNSVQHPNDWGLDFDLNSDGKFMSWGAQNEGDPNGNYGIKFGWTRNSSARDFGMPWGGFWFNDNVMLHKNLRFDGGGIDVKDAYQLMKFAWIGMNGIKYPFFGSSNLKAGWLFGSHETYLVRNGGIINASKVLGALNGQKLIVPTKIRSNGTIAVYTTYHL